MPAGPLRENLSSLKNANIIIINGKKNDNFEQLILKINKNLDIYYSTYKPINLEQFKNKKFFALAGIGNPENFFKLIDENNLKIERKLVFPDHYKFSKIEIQKIIDEAELNNCEIIMTEKDYYKINSFKLGKINYLRVKLEIKEFQELINKINLLYD